ncbi:ABC transporter family substrate-binding protein [uncultured Microbacterium sp.]|uniref:ABC transporter family substrate-binding protein n=1 Tax=uncultured Microbacterium sp. TaxID=191216 RepID=UPI0026272E51|nr:ABC transporter family substrate-binding protein [uncultured Microbacterium sp.]
MKQQKLMGAIAISGVLALALAGCAADTGSNDGNTTPTETKASDYNPQPRENLQVGGEVRFPIAEIPEQLNSFNGDASADTARVAAWYMPQILLQKDDGTPYKHDAYLDAWDIDTVDGNTQITFTFTDDAHWNDGTDMDWTAIDATWKANSGKDEAFNPNATDGYKQIASVEQGDTAKTAIVTFDGEFAWPEMPFLTGIIHPALADAETFNTAMIDDPHAEWGAGPYTIDEFDPNSDYVSYVPNPEWWGDEPLLEKVSFQGLDSSASINAFKADEIDTVEVTSKDRLEQVKGMDGIELYRATQTASTLIQVDAEKPQFEDVKVREAFFKAINIDQQKEIAWNGLDYEEEPAGSLTLFPFQPGYSNALAEAGWEYNPDASKELLEEAGWTENTDGIREKDGETLTVVYPVWNDSPTNEALAKALQAQMKEVGIDLQIDIRPPSDFSDDYNSKNWDVSSLRFTSSDPFGAAWFCQLYCMDMGLNLSGVQNAEMDQRIHDEVESLATSDEQTAAAMKLEAEIFQDWGIIPLYNGPIITAAKTGLANLTPESYVGMDGFGVQPVENVGWEK